MRKKLVYLVSMGVICMCTFVYGSDLTSTSFIIRDPLVGTGGSFGTSGSYQLYGSGNVLGTGRGVSVNYVGEYGFLYFPEEQVPQSLSMALSDTTIGFGSLSVSNPRFATTTGGSNTDTIAHTITAASNADSGYVLTYKGASLTSGPHAITEATAITGNGTVGNEQFGISIGTDGQATIPSAYQQTGPTRSFVPQTTTVLAYTDGPTESEVYDLHYLANIAPATPAGQYTTAITYAVTANF